MKFKFLLVAVLWLGSKQSFAQARLRKLPANINHTSVNNYAPYVSLDGNTLLFVSDQAEDNALTMSYTVRDGVNWKDPVVLPKTVNNHLNFLRGFALSVDGKTMYLSNMRSNGIGGFDLYTTQLTGTTWSEPQNMMLPANSKSNEACPSVSADGSQMFFMRCDKMDFNKADGCRIVMMTRKNNGQWSEPVDLPAVVNTGNSQTPRMMGDGETLVFSSNKIIPNKGGMDLYMTRLTNGQWSSPVPLDFANTPGDDQYVSAASLGRYLVKDMPGQRNNELVELLFPAEIRPKAVIKIEGNVTGVDPTTAYVSVFNVKDQSRVFSTKPDKDGNFIAYVKEGSLYDLSVDPEKDNYLFFSKEFDLTGEKFSQVEKVNVNLKPAESEDEVTLAGISFKPNTFEITPTSAQELRRVVRLMQGNPGKSFSILVTLKGYRKDSVRTDSDLTELLTDSLRIPITYTLQPADATDSVRTVTRDSIVVKKTYHNDRTLKQAKAISDYLVAAGIPSGRLACSGKADLEAVLENRKTLVSIVIH